ncbi:MAG: ribosomal protein S18-alanine N-acetyltransferase [Gammaproteobacteria bacterium]|nr:ribosomal protein S18-alanine N-acetyltransferase [Gammaproteobacteria bacterium]
MNLRPMLEADLGEVLQIEIAAYTFPWDRNIFKGCLRDNYCCRVLELDGEVAAFAIMTLGAGEAHLLNLCVEPGRQNVGLGDHLLKSMLDYAGEHEATVMFLEVRTSNSGARSFYERLGFVEVGLRNGYYPARFGREDAIIMAKEMA